MKDKNCYVCQKDILKKYICKNCYFKLKREKEELEKQNENVMAEIEGASWMNDAGIRVAMYDDIEEILTGGS